MRRFLVACVALVLLAVPAMADDGIGEEVLPDDTVSVPVVDIPPSDDVLEDLPVDSEEDTPPVVDEVPPGDGEEVPPETLPPVEDIPPVDEVPLEDGEAGSPPEDIPEDDLDSVTLSDIYRLLSDSGQFEPSSSEEDEEGAADVALFALSGDLPCPYVDCRVSGLGDVRVYFPINRQYDTFAVDASGQLINVTDSTVYGYVVSSGPYRVRFDSFSGAAYRLLDSSNSWRDATVSDVTSSTVSILDEGNPSPLLPDTQVLACLILFLLGVVVVCLFMRH